MSQYHVYVSPSVLREIKGLPGHMRQRVRRAIDALENDPRPVESKPLEIPRGEQDVPFEARRLRLDQWRIVYAVTESDRAVDVVAVRKRPPYDYGDLERLIADIE